LAGEVPQSQVDGLGLGADAVAIHHRAQGIVIDLDAGPRPRHARTVHDSSKEARSGFAVCDAAPMPATRGSKKLWDRVMGSSAAEDGVSSTEQCHQISKDCSISDG
jgi:hypothetical protein